MTHSIVIKLAVIILLSIFPSLISILILHRVRRRWQSRLEVCLMTNYGLRDSVFGINENSIGLKTYFVGDLSCQYNAHSPYLRCAVNPEGPCHDCQYYQEK